MKAFIHQDVSSVANAVSAADEHSVFIAGGTDLLGSLKDEILRVYPQKVINLKTVTDMDYIKDEGGALKIGALTKVDTVATSDIVKQKAGCLAEAAAKVSSPTIRLTGTIGGNICQAHRCWYFRSPNNRFDCIRKGGQNCFAMTGDARYHSIFGGVDGCVAVNPQDTAPALVALGATIVTNKREMAAEDFFKVNVSRSTALEDTEVVKEIKVPVAEKSAFTKYALRKSIDFAIVNCAVAQTASGVRVVLGGVYPVPLRSTEAEAEIANGINADTAKKAGVAAVSAATPLKNNSYKVPIAQALVTRTLLRLV
jgi:xanthine dehydrogenase YagS FAD-binding subunit